MEFAEAYVDWNPRTGRVAYMVVAEETLETIAFKSAEAANAEFPGAFDTDTDD